MTTFHPNPRSDEAIDALQAVWRQAQAGDEHAYRRVLGVLAGRLRAYFLHRCRGLEADVEDLVQETLLAIHLQRGTCDAEVPVLKWTHAIARHKWVDALRRHGRRAALHEPLDDLAETLEATVAEDIGARRDVAVLLARLSDAQRLAIVHTRLEGLSVAEAAERTGQSVSAVKVNVHRGLKKLAALMRRTGEETP